MGEKQPNYSNYWDQEAPFWRDHSTQFREVSENLINFIRLEVEKFVAKLPADNRILNLGSGANQKDYFFNFTDVNNIISLDLSRNMLKFNEARDKIRADAGKPLPIKSRSIDLCTSFFLTRYLSPEGNICLLKEMR